MALLERVSELYGTDAQIAAAVGISRKTVSGWRTRGMETGKLPQYVPLVLRLLIERAERSTEQMEATRRRAADALGISRETFNFLRGYFQLLAALFEAKDTPEGAELWRSIEVNVRGMHEALEARRRGEERPRAVS